MSEEFVIHNRRTFTRALAMLILKMVEDGEQPIVDYVLRSSEEQNRLFSKGLSKCDGYKIKSSHQSARAADMYLCNPDGSVQYEWDPEKAKKYHGYWESLGGKKMIDWDKGHFE